MIMWHVLVNQKDLVPRQMVPFDKSHGGITSVTVGAKIFHKQFSDSDFPLPVWYCRLTVSTSIWNFFNPYKPSIQPSIHQSTWRKKTILETQNDLFECRCGLHHWSIHDNYPFFCVRNFSKVSCFIRLNLTCVMLLPVLCDILVLGQVHRRDIGPSRFSSLRYIAKATEWSDVMV